MVKGKPTYPENTLPAFRNAAGHGWVLEFDVKLTRDGVPVVIHDPGLERVTDCDGLVADRTLAELRKCRVDVLGSPGAGVPLGLLPVAGGRSCLVSTRFCALHARRAPRSTSRSRTRPPIPISMRPRRLPGGS